LFGGPVPDRSLLFLAWPASPLDSPIALVIAAYVTLTWETREELELLLPALVRSQVDPAAAEASGPNAIFHFVPVVLSLAKLGTRSDEAMR
jgi:hypothetical protein